MEEFNQTISEESNDEDQLIPVAHPLGQQRVFICALLLTLADLLYIYYILPESIQELSSLSSGSSVTSSSSSIYTKFIPNITIPQIDWSPLDALRIFSGDPLLKVVGKIAFLYYTALWAVVSTLMLYATKRFHMGPERLGELISSLGLCTMIAEAVLVRMFVPMFGEKQAMRIGLIAFALQCTVLGFAFKSWHLFICVAFSTLGNLVYPSLSSLVSSSVAPESVGEALGAINGIKALTEGVGPLFFGTLMTLSEKSMLPGWPYLIAALFSLAAFRETDQLPKEDEYLSEKYSSLGRHIRKGNKEKKLHNTQAAEQDEHDEGSLEKNDTNDSALGSFIFNWFDIKNNTDIKSANDIMKEGYSENLDDELSGLLSEIDTDFEEYEE